MACDSPQPHRNRLEQYRDRALVLGRIKNTEDPSDQRVAAAELAEEYAQAKGIDPSRIVVTTREEFGPMVFFVEVTPKKKDEKPTREPPGDFSK